MTGAIEFLRKAKAICESITNGTNPCEDCPINGLCIPENIENEADLVRKVMEYRLEDGDAERN